MCTQTVYIQSMKSIAMVNEATECAINQIVLTQMGMKAGIWTYGEAGMRPIYKEMKKFYGREVVKPLMPCNVRYDVKRRALDYLMFLKMKKMGRLKR